jgi:hypothetical protein
VPRRRSHNRYREVFDQELAGRPLLADGLPCGRCGFPVLAARVRARRPLESRRLHRVTKVRRGGRPPSGAVGAGNRQRGPALASNCERLTRRLEAAPAGRARVATPTPSQDIAEAVATLVGDLAKTVITAHARSRHGPETVVLSVGVAADARGEVIDRLMRQVSADCT